MGVRCQGRSSIYSPIISCSKELMPLECEFHECLSVYSLLRPDKMHRGAQNWISPPPYQRGSTKPNTWIRFWFNSFSWGQTFFFLRRIECSHVFQYGYFSPPLQEAWEYILLWFSLWGWLQVLEVKLSKPRVAPPGTCNSQTWSHWATCRLDFPIRH